MTKRGPDFQKKEAKNLLWMGDGQHNYMKTRGKARGLDKALIRDELADAGGEMTDNPVKEIYQKHGLTEPCHICHDNHIPQATWRDQSKRCKADNSVACLCCQACSETCKGGVV